jgi:transposase
LREIVNAIFYIAQTCCQWWRRPKDFPPFTTVQYYFYRWRRCGLWVSINHELVMFTREAEGREASPSAGVIDSQDAGGPSGYDAGKKIRRSSGV